MSKVRAKSNDTARRSGLLKTLCIRQNSRCYWCGNPLIFQKFKDRAGKTIHDDAGATIDHVIALAAGGATDDKNCVAACQGCNLLRASFNAGVLQRKMQDNSQRYHQALVDQYTAETLVRELQERVRQLIQTPCPCPWCRLQNRFLKLAAFFIRRSGYELALS